MDQWTCILEAYLVLLNTESPDTLLMICDNDEEILTLSICHEAVDWNVSFWFYGVTDGSAFVFWLAYDNISVTSMQAYQCLIVD